MFFIHFQKLGDKIVCGNKMFAGILIHNMGKLQHLSAISKYLSADFKFKKRIRSRQEVIDIYSLSQLSL